MTTVVPIVLAIANDPIGSSLVSNLSRPGGNVTGLSLEATEIAGKRLQLLHDAVPHFCLLGVIFDAGYSASMLQGGEVQAAAHTLSVEVELIKIRRAKDIASSFEALGSHKMDALYVAENALVQTNGRQIAAFALSAPTTNGLRCTPSGSSWWIDLVRPQISRSVSAGRRDDSTRREVC